MIALGFVLVCVIDRRYVKVGHVAIHSFYANFDARGTP